MGELVTAESEMFHAILRKMLDKEAYPYFKESEQQRDISRSFWQKLGDDGCLYPNLSLWSVISNEAAI